MALQEKITPLPLIPGCSAALQERVSNQKGGKKGFCHRLSNYASYKKPKLSEFQFSHALPVSESFVNVSSKKIHVKELTEQSRLLEMHKIIGFQLMLRASNILPFAQL